MSVTADELIDLTLRKLILKCEVKPHTHPPIPAEKIAQRVTLLPTPSTPILVSSQPKQGEFQHSQPEQVAGAAIVRGNSEYNKGQYGKALKEYQQSLTIYSKANSRQYYKILMLMVECQKKLKHYPQTKHLYEEISLVYNGKL